jgi:hypothetical protein
MENMEKIIKCMSSIGLGSIISIGVICHGGPGDEAGGNNSTINNNPNNNPSVNNNLQKINIGTGINNPNNDSDINNNLNNESTVTKPVYTSWVSVDEAIEDVFLWRSGERKSDDIKGKIEATANEALNSKDPAKIESALCKLWKPEVAIGAAIYTIRKLIESTKGAPDINEKLKKLAKNSGEGISPANSLASSLANNLIQNKLSFDDFMAICADLINVLENKRMELARKILSTDHEQELDDDFDSFTLDKAYIWEAIRNKKFYDFDLWVDQMIVLYNNTKNSKYRELIKKEFENLIEKYNGNVGPFGDKIENFNGLNHILNK